MSRWGRLWSWCTRQMLLAKVSLMDGPLLRQLWSGYMHSAPTFDNVCDSTNSSIVMQDTTDGREHAVTCSTMLQLPS
jgi:hypothetical protein